MFKNFVRLIAFLLVLFFPSRGFSLFDQDVGSTLTVSLGIDVSGTVKVTPYVVTPVGQIVTQSPVTLTNQNYTFSTFSISNPFIGPYTVGIFINSTTDSVVAIDTTNTYFAEPIFTLAVQPTDSYQYSVSPSAGDITTLIVHFDYVTTDFITPP